MTTPVHDFIGRYADSDFERCHTPGHKGQAARNGGGGFTDGGINRADITEIPGAVSIIEESERNAAELFGARRTLFSCSGSTLAIAAMLGFCKGKRVTAFRGAHRSFADAAILLGFDIDFVYPGDCVADYVNGETAAIFVTSVDYYGNVTEIPRVQNIPVLADNAHGAYLVFTDSHPVQNGAAMSADSAHKTLPALTGAAYLHISRDCGAEAEKSARDSMLLFGSSSPSYLILESLDLCNRHIAEEKERARAAFAAVASLKENLRQIGYSPLTGDLLRVTVDANAYGYSGDEFAKELYNRKIVCEMYDPRHVVLLFSTVAQNKNAQRAFEAMRDIPRKQAVNVYQPREIGRLKSVASPREAYFSLKRTVPVKEAVGEVCGGVHATIPPCAPLVIPGEVVSDEAALSLESAGICEIDVVIS